MKLLNLRNTNILKTLFLLLLTTFSFNGLYAQSPLIGKWNASCFLERKPNGSLCMSGICPFNDKNPQQMEIKDFELEFNEQTVQIKANEKSTVANFTYNKTIESISFEYNKTPYNFKLLRSSNASTVILKDESCACLVLLNKK